MNLSIAVFVAALASGLAAPAAPPPDLVLAPGVKAPPSPTNELTLPKGRLQGLAAGSGQAFLLDLDRTESRRGDIVIVWMLYVTDPPVTRDDAAAPVVEQVMRGRVDCARSTFQVTDRTMFDAQGRMVGWRGAETDTSSPKGSPADKARMIVCEGFVWDGPVFVGHVAAAKAARDRLHDERLEKKP